MSLYENKDLDIEEDIIEATKKLMEIQKAKIKNLTGKDIEF